MMKTMMAAAAMLVLMSPAFADNAEEALSRECNGIYAKLCKGIKRGPELVGKCAEKYPDIMSKIPEKCTTDFQTNVENYNEAKGQK